MCGICGEVAFGGRPDPERVRAMAASLAHRGPDGEGLWDGGEAVLGHRRLKVIDLSDAAAQPMADPTGRYLLAFNGEIYNFLEVREALEGQGERFFTRSDTEVLLRALVRWGLDGLQRIDGMWAFALWDRQERTLLLSRDRAGVKPLYWARTARGAVFASEIPPLLLHPEVGREIHPAALAEQVACRYVLAPRTLLRDVKKLPPGHLLALSEGSARLFPYWRLPLGEPVRDGLPADEARRRFGSLFEAAVRRQLIADVKVGVLLSGGVDSSALAAAVRRAGSGALHTFTVAFAGKGAYDERQYARAVARRLEADHHELVITPEFFARSLGTVLDRLDDPVADAAVLPLFHVCGLARREVTVLLSGQGADEILGGYHLERVLAQIRALLRFRRLPGARRVAALLGRRDPKRAYLLRWEELRSATPGQIPGRIRYDLTLPLEPARMASLLKDPPPPPYDRTLDAFYMEVPPHRGPLDAILSVLFKGWLADNLLCHSDRMSMAHSLEMRVPFLDGPLVDFAFSLPEERKVSGSCTKAVLKAYAVEAGIPRSLAYRRKKGFPVPWGAWVRGPLRPFVEEVLEGASWMEPYFRKEGLRAVLREHLEGTDHGLLLWNLVVLAHWGGLLSRGPKVG
ncbi:MAG: asparagine synthase (glutamine-hydrolyzing) [Acidobacteriota bacterium]